MVELDREELIRRCKVARDRKRELQKRTETEWEEEQRQKFKDTLDATDAASSDKSTGCSLLLKKINQDFLGDYIPL